MPSPELFDSPHGSKEVVLEEEQAPSGVKAVVTSNIEISDGKKGLHELLERNRVWAASIVDTSPYFFYKLSKQQSPEILWIGTSLSCIHALGGHYGCSGVKAALSHQEFGIVDNWIRNIKDLYIEQRKKFGGR
ncbi:hypothetical protein DYB32_007375, partial [Aphanomyces invadans]